MAQTHSLIASFIVGNLHSEVTVEELWEALELKKYPGQQFIELLLAVDKRGHSKGHAFLQIPLGCSDRLMKHDGCKLRGLKMVVTKEKGNAHLINNKKLVMSYKEQGMIKSTLFRPNLIYRYKPKENQASSSVEKSDIVVPQYDMCADLTHKKFAKDLDMVVAQCFKLGIEAIIVPGICRKQRKEAIDIVNRYNIFIKMYFATGVAPKHADEYNEEEKKEIEKEFYFSKCRCIGPIGLDYRLTKITHEQQMLAFEEQLQLACEKQMPLYLEEHEAHKEFVDVLKKYEDKLPKCAIIDFTGTTEELKCYIAMGFYIAVSGSCGANISYISTVITKALQDGEIPKDKVLLCSNAPRKTPINHDMGFRDILSSARDKLPLDKTRAEPLGIFLTQDVMAKYFGFKEQDEAIELGKIIVKNSKDFLTTPNQDSEKCAAEKEVEKVKKVEPHCKTVENVDNPHVFLAFEFENVDNQHVFFALSLFLVAIFLEYVSGVHGMWSSYFFHQTLF